MDTWNREQLYADVWEKPLTQLMAKYGISAVALGKVCRKLNVPVPGRGYWAKKQFGKPVKQTGLPQAKDLPIVERLKFPPPEGTPPPAPIPEPTDREWHRIKEVEKRFIAVPAEAKFHKLVESTLRNLAATKEEDERGILLARQTPRALDVRVSRRSVDRALRFLNTVIESLAAEGFTVSIS